MKKKKDHFKGKIYTGPAKISRLPVVFAKKQKKGLTQTHRDIIDSIYACNIKKIENSFIKRKDGSELYVALGFVISPYDVLKFLGHRDIHNHKWLFQKLHEIQQRTIEIKTDDFKMIMTIISSLTQVRVKKTETEKKKTPPKEKTYFLINFSPEFYFLILRDLGIYLSKERIKAIISLKSDFLKALVRFCITHERLNMDFNTILVKLGYQSIDKGLKARYKKLLLKHSEYLLKSFNIRIVESLEKVYIFYTKKPSIVAIDYEKHELPNDLTYILKQIKENQVG